MQRGRFSSNVQMHGHRCKRTTFLGVFFNIDLVHIVCANSISQLTHAHAHAHAHTHTHKESVKMKAQVKY